MIDMMNIIGLFKVWGQEKEFYPFTFLPFYLYQ